METGVAQHVWMDMTDPGALTSLLDQVIYVLPRHFPSLKR